MKDGKIIFDKSGWAIGAIWQCEDGSWKGKKFPWFNTPSLCPSTSRITEEEIISWVEKI